MIADVAAATPGAALRAVGRSASSRDCVRGSPSSSSTARGTAAGAGATSRRRCAPTARGSRPPRPAWPSARIWRSHVDLSTHVDELAGCSCSTTSARSSWSATATPGWSIAGAAARAGGGSPAGLPRRVRRGDGQSMFDLLRPERRKVYEADQRRADPVAGARGLRGHGPRRPRGGDRLTRSRCDVDRAARRAAAAAAQVRPLHPRPLTELRRLRGALRGRDVVDLSRATTR